MTDIFISYAKQDRALAEALSQNLTKRGYSAWWDFELVGGEDFRDEISGLAKTVTILRKDTVAQKVKVIATLPKKRVLG